MTKTLMDIMVEKFLQWKLPADFVPDGGISFKKESDYDHPEHGRTKFEPTGTNLFHAGQARAMLEIITAPMQAEIDSLRAGAKIELKGDREALIALQRICVATLRDIGRFTDDEGEMTNQLEQIANMLEADAQEIARSQGQEITKNDAKRDTLRTRLNIIMGQINQLEWKTGVGGSYFETVQEQCDAIVKDFGLKRLSSHLMSLPHTWVRRNTGLTDGYEIIEPRGCYVPANQAQQVAAPQGLLHELRDALKQSDKYPEQCGTWEQWIAKIDTAIKAAPQPPQGELK